MHRTRLYGLTALFLAALLILPACSDDDDPAAPANVGDPPEFDTSDLDNYEIPAAMESSGDATVQEIMGYLERFDWVDLRLARLEPPATKAEASDKAGPWSYTWTEGEPGYDELTYTLRIQELADSYAWDLRSTGTRYEVVYTNYLNLMAQLAKNKTWGWLEEYDPWGDGTLQFRFAWSLSGTTLTATLDVHDPFSPYRIVAVVELDGSGNLSFYQGVPGEGWLWFYSVWDAAGAGTWERYDSEGGVVGSGTFGGPTG